VTYLFIILSLVAICSVGMFVRSKYISDFSAVLTFCMMTFFSMSSNSDHQNYIAFVDSSDLSLIEPLSALYMIAAGYILPEALFCPLVLLLRIFLLGDMGIIYTII